MPRHLDHSCPFSHLREEVAKGRCAVKRSSHKRDRSMNTTVDGGEEEDYLDHFSRLVPWQRSLTSLERLLIVSTVATFISIIACILLCVIWSRSPRRWRSRRKLGNHRLTRVSRALSIRNVEQHILMRARSRSDGLVVSSPPQYESIIKADSITAQNASEKRRQFGRKPSLRTISEGDVVESTGVWICLVDEFTRIDALSLSLSAE